MAPKLLTFIFEFLLCGISTTASFYGNSNYYYITLYHVFCPDSKRFHRLGKRKALDFNEIVQGRLAADPTGKPVPFPVAGEIFNPKILSGYYYLKKGADAP